LVAFPDVKSDGSVPLIHLIPSDILSMFPTGAEVTLRVAIVHDWLNQQGGAEVVLEALKEVYPEAPIFTSIYSPDLMPDRYRTWDIRTSFMSRVPLIPKHPRLFLPLYPLAFQSFDLHLYDVVISISSAFSHGVITPAGSTHICYCLTPARFLWDYHRYSQRERIGALARAVLPTVLAWLRQRDQQSARRVNHFISISKTVQARVRNIYERDSEVLYPPVKARSIPLGGNQDDFFLIISRLVPYKRIDVAIEAFNELNKPLWIVGTGRDESRLHSLANANVRFLGRLSTLETWDLMGRCQALIFPGEEDFGIVPLEVQAAGRPVIALAAGGALETVVDGKTGAFFQEQTPEALADAIRAFPDDGFDPDAIRRHALKFDQEVFQSRFRKMVERKSRGDRTDGRAE
jgi:glycosyltransferase involved in cell wall biosynthesis